MIPDYEKLLLQIESLFVLTELLQKKETLYQEEIDLIKISEAYYNTLKSLESLYIKVCKSYEKCLEKNSTLFSEPGILSNFRLNSLPEITGTKPLPQLINKTVNSKSIKKHKKEKEINLYNLLHKKDKYIPTMQKDLSYKEYMSTIKNTQRINNPESEFPKQTDDWLSVAAGFHVSDLNPISKVINND